MPNEPNDRRATISRHDIARERVKRSLANRRALRAATQRTGRPAGKEVSDQDLAGLIHKGYAECAASLTEIKRQKRESGGCGGEFNCMQRVPREQAVKLCPRCRKIAKERREATEARRVAGEPKRALSDYAKIWKRLTGGGA